VSTVVHVVPAAVTMVLIAMVMVVVVITISLPPPSSPEVFVVFLKNVLGINIENTRVEEGTSLQVSRKPQYHRHD
jgi:hypothetical protein